MRVSPLRWMRRYSGRLGRSVTRRHRCQRRSVSRGVSQTDSQRIRLGQSLRLEALPLYAGYPQLRLLFDLRSTHLPVTTAVRRTARSRYRACRSRRSTARDRLSLAVVWRLVGCSSVMGRGVKGRGRGTTRDRGTMAVDSAEWEVDLADLCSHVGPRLAFAREWTSRLFQYVTA